MVDTPSNETQGPQLNADYSAEIGRIAVAWSAVELSIGWAIWAVADVPESIGACMTSQIYSFDAKMKALLSLLKLRGATPSLLKKVNKFADESRGPLEIRNRTLHDSWGWRADGTIARFEITAPRTLKFEAIHTPLSELKANGQTLRRFAGRARELRREIYAELPSWPRIQHGLSVTVSDPLRPR